MSTVLEVLSAGTPLSRAAAVAILVHGRGASAESMLSLAEALAVPDIAYLAPQATQGSWYPYSFLAPLSANEPHLSRALDQLGRLVEDVRANGVPAGRIVLAGFSQGGCLGLEYAARNPIGLAAVAGLSAGLIGPPETPRDYPGSLAGTQVLLGCSDVDRHIPLTRVKETAHVLRGMGADVDERIYPGMGHTINDDEIRALRSLLAQAKEIAGPHGTTLGETA